jgi:hypothetical protein
MNIFPFSILLVVFFYQTVFSASIPAISVNLSPVEDFARELYRKDLSAENPEPFFHPLGQIIDICKGPSHDLKGGLQAIINHLKTKPEEKIGGLILISQSLSYEDKRRLEEILSSFFHLAGSLLEDVKSDDGELVSWAMLANTVLWFIPLFKDILMVSRLLCFELDVEFCVDGTLEKDFLKNTEAVDLLLIAYGVLIFGNKIVTAPTNPSERFLDSWNNLGKRTAQFLIEALDILTSVEQPVTKDKAAEFTKALGELNTVKGEVENLRSLYPKSIFNDKVKFLVLFVSALSLFILLNVMALLLITK